MTSLAEIVQPPPAVEVRRATPPSAGSDRYFRILLRTLGGTVLAVMATVGYFLLRGGVQALSVAHWHFLTTAAWEPDSHNFGVAAVITGSILIALVAIAFALPVAIAMALYISEYAPARLRRTFVGAVDLMAAVPSVVYGIWGAKLLSGQVEPVAKWITNYLGWLPLLKVDGAHPSDPLDSSTAYGTSTFIAGLVVALMITPIASSVMREVFSQAPIGEREGAYALGATRWGMIRTVVLPFGRGGMIGGTMLGLGRAMGETIAVAMIISPIFVIQPHILQSGGSSVSALIALKYGAATPLGTSALMAAGLALFLLTLVVNFGASIVIARSRSGALSEA